MPRENNCSQCQQQPWGSAIDGHTTPPIAHQCMISRRAGPIVLFDQAPIVAALFEALRGDIFALVLTSLLPTSDSGELLPSVCRRSRSVSALPFDPEKPKGSKVGGEDSGCTTEHSADYIYHYRYIVNNYAHAGGISLCYSSSVRCDWLRVGCSGWLSCSKSFA